MWLQGDVRTNNSSRHLLRHQRCQEQRLVPSPRDTIWRILRLLGGRKNAVLVRFVEFRLSFRNQDTKSFKNMQKNFLLHRHFKSRFFI